MDLPAFPEISTNALRTMLRRCVAIAVRKDVREDWRRSRFLALAAKHTPAVAVDDRRGNRYFVDPRDPQIGRSLFLLRSFDVGKMKTLTTALTGTEITQVLDIGANIGTSVIELLSCYPNARGVAFEPDADNFGLLSHNVLANGLSHRVVTYNVALSDIDAELTFELAADNPGDHRVRLGPAQPGRFGELDRATTTVPARTLDAFISEGLVSVDAHTLAYLDAQGHEGHILAGARRLLDAHGPIAMEFWPYGLRRANSLERVLELIANFDQVLNLDDEGRRLDAQALSELVTVLDANSGHVDLLLLP